MHIFKDTTNAIEEQASERMNFRTKPHIKQAIQRAAALIGVDDSVFTMSAAYQSALATIKEHDQKIVQPADHAALFNALDNPPTASDDLRVAFKRHEARLHRIAQSRKA